MAWNDAGIAPSLRIAWDYMRLVHRPGPADAILTLGSFDPQAAVHAAALWKAGLAPVVIMSGGIAHRGGLLDTGWDRSEARVFADAAIGEGVPQSAILLEGGSQNTADNFILGLGVAEQAGIRVRRAAGRGQALHDAARLCDGAPGAARRRAADAVRGYRRRRLFRP